MSDKIKELTGGQGADVLYDPIGDQYAEPALRAMNWEGRYLVIGFAAGEIPKIPLNLTLLKGCDVLGVFWGMATQRDPKHANESLQRDHADDLRRQAASRRLGQIPAGRSAANRSAC